VKPKHEFVYYIVAALVVVTWYWEKTLQTIPPGKIFNFLSRVQRWFSNINLPQVGSAEANACLAAFDHFLGRRLFSKKRWFAAFVLVLVFYSFFYTAVETDRLLSGLNVRPPFIGPHYGTYPVISIMSGAISLSMTRAILALSLLFSATRRFTILWFVSAIYVSVCIAIIFFELTIPVLGSLTTLFDLAQAYIVDRSWHNVIAPRLHGGQVRLTAHEFLISIVLTELQHLQEWNTYRDIRATLLLPFTEPHLGYFVINDAATEKARLGGFYVEWNKLCFTYLRVIFAFMFFSIWVLYHIHRCISAALLHFLHMDRGALAIMMGLLGILTWVYDIIFL
jgi:hypothetical protein